METTYHCNQCGETVAMNDISMQFNAGYGVVTVCKICKPPASAEELMRDMNDFMGMVGGTPPVDFPKP